MADELTDDSGGETPGEPRGQLAARRARSSLHRPASDARGHLAAGAFDGPRITERTVGRPELTPMLEGHTVPVEPLGSTDPVSSSPPKSMVKAVATSTGGPAGRRPVRPGSCRRPAG
jgi:hypothetical protein